MEIIIRDVRDINNSDREAIEHLVGQSLRDNQRLIFQIVGVDLKDTPTTESSTNPTNQLPDWCNVFEGLSDAEIADLEKSIFRSRETRSFSSFL